MTKSSNVSIALTAQVKMALHASKHGFSNPIHGIVLGKQSNANNSDGASSLQVVNVVPVCHEVPTKPIVDMALRLTDAYLQQEQNKQKMEGVRVVGWYTANANAPSKDNDQDDELPNTSACRIVSSLAENAAVGDDNGNGDEQFVLLLVSTSRLVDSTQNEYALPICTVFEKDKSRTFTQRVGKERISVISTTIDGNNAGDDLAGEVLSEAMEQQQLLSFSENGGDAAAGVGGGGNIAIYDYVDHLMDCGRGDWIENGVVDKFVLDSFR
mmetsp:Transcript_31864/g.66978  ORF Transcript_31864/g.66978 Transcript_31864/m.66978 type:complete len:269 (+) Transcript_31864:120-926(+)